MKTIGNQLGPFRLLSVLGEGGMGRVYEGEHVKTQRRYAIKTAHATSPLFRNHLRAELTALSTLQHPNIVKVRMNGVDDEIPWYAMDLLKGPTLRSYLHGSQSLNGPTTKKIVNLTPITPKHIALPIGQNMSIGSSPIMPRIGNGKDGILDKMNLDWICLFFQHLCEALNYLHSQGIVHGDIKPENIFVINNKTPMLVDLGIASLFGQDTRDQLSTNDRSIGTIAYAPLEQINGKLLDPRADLYALGCTLFECLTGVQPFKRQTHSATMTAKNLSDFPKISQQNKKIPLSIDMLINRLLAKHPHHRIGHAVDVASILHTINPLPKLEHQSSTAASTYLYRPPLVGREHLLDSISQHLNQTISGKGTGLLLKGESGIGKTRLASEITQVAHQLKFEIIGLCCEKFGEQKNSAPLTENISSLQDLLSQIEQTGLIEVTNGKDNTNNSETNKEELGINRHSFSTLLDYTISVLLACAKKKPILLLIDDLQQADELLVEFLSTLVAKHIHNNKILILAMARMDNSFSNLKLTPIPLPRLTDEQVCTQVKYMLAVDHPPKELVSYICDVSGGMPLLVIEHLHAAIDASVLQRNRLQGWTVKLSENQSLAKKIPSSQSIKDLITNRLAQLDHQTLSIVQTAAILGREFTIEDLKALCHYGENQLNNSISLLRQREILEFEGAIYIRFTHVRLHEHIYNSVPERKLLHQQAATILKNGNNPNRVAALAFHYDKSGNPQEAAHYYEIAGREAITNQNYSYAEQALESALRNLNLVPNKKDKDRQTQLHLMETLGDVANILRHHEKAATSYQWVAKHSTNNPVQLARQQRKLATVYQTNRDISFSYLIKALLSLGEEGANIPQRRPEWIQTNIQCLWAHYWKNEPREILTLTKSITKVVDEHGTPKQRGELYLMTALGEMQFKRYLTSENEIRLARLSVLYLSQSDDIQGTEHARFVLSMTQLFAGHLDEAQEGFERTINKSKITSNITLELRGLTYLALLHRLRSDIEQTRQIATAAQTLADANGMPEYSATAMANLSWIAYLEGDFKTSENLARKAFAHWKNSPIGYPFCWTALFPLLGVFLAMNEKSELHWLTARLLDQHQQVLPENLTNQIQQLHDFTTSNAFSNSPVWQKTVKVILTLAKKNNYI